MPMDEDAMFKALLKNKPQPKQIPQAPAAVKEVKETFPPAPPARQPSYPSKGSEDAMYKALLHSRPLAPVQKPPARVELKPEPVAAAPVHHEPVVVTQVSPHQEVDLGPVVSSIKDLTASVNQVHSLLKTFVVPIVVLTLLVALAIIVKINI